MCGDVPIEMPTEMPSGSNKPNGPTGPVGLMENEVSNGEQLEGENLIQTLVALTGLPEGMANAEMNQILELSGHEPEKRSDITLDELRAALIAYLEALEPTCLE
jgi:hypothetical protein